MHEPEPRDQNQPRMRNRLTGDIQTPRRPRAVAGQRAAAKRARQPERGDDHDASVAAANSTAATTAVATLAEPSENVESEAHGEPPAGSMSEAEYESGPEAEPDADAAVTGSKTPRRTAERPWRLRTSGPRRAVVTAVLALGVVVVLAAATILGVQYRDAVRTDHARTAAVAAAEKAAPVIFSYDYRHLDQDFAKAEALLTGSFRDQYAKTTQTVVKPTALQYQGVVQALVAKPSDGGAPAVSVVSASPDQVVVLAFINQSTTSTRVSGTKVDQNRVLLTLTHTAQGWLVSGVNAL